MMVVTMEGEEARVTKRQAKKGQEVKGKDAGIPTRGCS